MKPIADKSNVCECVVLDGHRAKSISNSNEPPNSFHTSDLFVPHPTIENAWKFIGRADDRVTLLNGEKVLPLPIEGRIVQDPLVKEAVVFGVDRPVPGILLFRADTKKANEMSDDEYLIRVWPSVEDANKKAEAFSQIGRSMVVIIGHDTKFPETDKSTIKRWQVRLRAINSSYTTDLPDSFIKSSRRSSKPLTLDSRAVKSDLELWYWMFLSSSPGL
jgi:long-subunit acyl-CoA synthetase (AMP-forming)